MNDHRAKDAFNAATAAIAAADPTDLVRNHARGHPLTTETRIIALGKAAPRMVWGLVAAGHTPRGIGITPPHIQAPSMEGFKWLVGDHPIAGDASFAAGEQLLDWVQRRSGGPVLVLLSGGASACVEVPAPGHTQSSVRELHRTLLASGEPIGRINQARATVSAIKAGGLARRLQEQGCDVHCWLMQDAPTIASVGSGPVHVPDVRHHVLADNGALVQAAALRLATEGYEVYRHGASITGDVHEEVDAFLSALAGIQGDKVALLGGGEPLVAVPKDAPPGGRNQHSALVAAGWLSRHASNALFAAIGSDGIDGTTMEAGAWATAEDADADALGAFEAHRHLDGRGRTWRMGPTGTNLSDLWIGLA